ncbi:MAG TPA: DUF2272 domain-containing protein [Stellaceae bacterium]|nr:DUF2272 domain-containing protein [Stellaceae bacterium]
MPLLLLALALAACAPQPPPAPPDDAHIPPFARLPYQPFSRAAAVEIALREWRAFGSTVVYPNQKLPYDAERSEGLWQRVGEYWWLGLPLRAPDQGFTGMHDRTGRVFPPNQDGNYAWSAAFIGYVMRMAGAGHRFPYTPTHADYINAAKQRTLGQRRDLAIAAEPPERYAPQRGDLICMWRGRRAIRYDELPTDRFPGHCNIVVALRAGSLDGIGGNLDDTVGMQHVPLTADGRLAQPDGTVVDPDHPWFVVIRIDYDINPPPAPTS